MQARGRRARGRGVAGRGGAGQEQGEGVEATRKEEVGIICVGLVKRPYDLLASIHTGTKSDPSLAGHTQVYRTIVVGRGFPHPGVPRAGRPELSASATSSAIIRK